MLEQIQNDLYRITVPLPGNPLKSLNRVKSFRVERTLTAHRENNGDFYGRIRALFFHHRDRLEDARQIIAANPGIDGYNVAANMQWSIRAKCWAEFPPGQRWFAVGESVAHLNFLVDQDAICRTVHQGVNTYTPAGTGEKISIEF